MTEQRRTLADITRDWATQSPFPFRAMLEPPALVQARIATELARARLVAVTGRGTGRRVAAEVERRQQLGMTERSALESVYDDVVIARWVP